ncbi:MAG TPA: hypothetical protein VHX13_00645 [Acidobacteriaceae bacterium]|jgi:hypothetical protein|nr:hypothetical protein [Acidobacteriaceae bacterium]
MRASRGLAAGLLGLFLAEGVAASAQSGMAQPRSASATIVYVNRQYGFRFTLPADCRGYSIVTDEWMGSAPANNERGPLLSIRDPRWTEEQPRQDIPIMIFTGAQWKLLQNGKLTVSAAPYDPGEIGRNRRYVFAIPPRYNFDEDPGYREVMEILKEHPLHAF